jgi:hypothetical protein
MQCPFSISKMYKVELRTVSYLLRVPKRRLEVQYNKETGIIYISSPLRRTRKDKKALQENVILVSNKNLVGISLLNPAEQVTGQYFNPRIEWEGFQQVSRIATITRPGSLPPGSQRIELGRDESYNIIGRVDGVFNNYRQKTDFLLGGVVYGSEVPRSEIEGFNDARTERYKLSGCTAGGIKQLSGVRTGPFEAWLTVASVVRKNDSDAEPSWLTKWFLNGPRSSIYTRFTARTTQRPYVRRRIFPENQETILNDTHQQKLDRDFALIQIPNRSFIIHAVPKEFGPEWSRNIGIEYRNDQGGIPSEQEREVIKEFIGFVIGRPLLSIGHTSFDELGRPIDEVADDPGWPLSRSLVELCLSGDYPSISLEELDIESALQQLSPSYIALRDELNLHEALWRYWLAKNFPLGTDLPVLASAVEGLATSWFKLRKSKTKGVYLPKDEFDRIIREEFGIINEKLKDVEYRERIMNRLRNAYNMGANERLQFFFEEINLPIGEIESEAIRSRNKMAHGSSLDYTDEERAKVTKLRWAYQTLFNRIMLKLLGFDGQYIDRTSEGWPRRHINEPMQGPI